MLHITSRHPSCPRSLDHSNKVTIPKPPERIRGPATHARATTMPTASRTDRIIPVSWRCLRIVTLPSLPLTSEKWIVRACSYFVTYAHHTCEIDDTA